MAFDEKEVLIATTESIPGCETKEYIGFVWASSARAKNALSEGKAFLKSIAGGRISEFESMMNAGRNDVVRQLVEAAKQKGANAIVGLRVDSTTIVSGTVETFGYGTAVVVRKKTR